MKQKLLTTLEVLGILIIGWTLTRILITVLGVPPLQDFLDEAIVSDSPDFIYLAKIGFVTLFLQFISLMIPAYLVTRFLHKDGLKSFGITKGKKPLKEQLIHGLVLFALLGIPMKLLLIANHFTDLGTVPEYWELFNKDWNFGFWVFMAVGSYAVIPVFEELFYRGYAQYRLEKAFAFFAVPFISLLFIATHFQYFIADAFNIFMLVSLFMLALGMAFSRYLSLSIITPIIIHALMNIPTKFPYDLIVLAIMITLVILFRKNVSKLINEFIDELKRTNLKGNAWFIIFIITFAVGMSLLPEITLIFFVLAFIVSITLQIINKKRKSHEA